MHQVALVAVFALPVQRVSGQRASENVHVVGVGRLDVREGGTGLPDGAALGGARLDAPEEGGEEGPRSGAHRSAENAGSLGVQKGSDRRELWVP